MALKFIQQNSATLLEAYKERQAEYDALRAAGRWAGAVLYAGTLLELALKLVMCKHLEVSNLPTIFQVHDLELLLYCSGLYTRLSSDDLLNENFLLIHKRWSMALRYEGTAQTQQDADDFDQALFSPSHGVITFFSQYF
jgi:hypothetical protein